MSKETKINADILINRLTTIIAKTVNIIEVLQKTNTVVIGDEYAEDFVVSLTKLFAKINECYRE